MASPSVPDPHGYVTPARSALSKIARGRGFDLTTRERLALAQANRVSGARKPLQDYAPRTQRRYLSGLARGEDVTTVNRRERAQRSLTPAGLQRLGQSLGHTPEDIDLWRDEYGARFMTDRFRRQREDIDAYFQGDTGPGAESWNTRDTITPLRGQVARSDIGMYYYHGALK